MGETALPVHVGIIMDGNGRWAKRRGLPRIAGHNRGADTFGKIVRHAAKRGIRYLTAYAFSTENWKRPHDEIEGIMNLVRSFLRDSEKYRSDNIKFRAIGDFAALAPDIRERISYLQDASRDMTGMTLCVALNYGGRGELLHAAKCMAQLYEAGGISDLSKIGEPEFSKYLYTAGMPDVDLVIRTSGEKRTSNFLIWQSVYAEYAFTDVLWPDFAAKHFDEALDEYAKRSRRHGGI